MLPTIDQGHGEPTLVLMHVFGSSKRDWAQPMAILSASYRCVAIDLPGFGDARALRGYSVETMVGLVRQTLDQLNLKQFVLVGHSMSGKIAMAITARSIAGLVGLVLVTPSPPSPEPVTEKGRSQMLAMKRNRSSAGQFFDGITAKPLEGAIRETAIEDFIQCSPEAWKAWLDDGSKEDWKERVGMISCPTLVVCGSADPSLSRSVQEETTMMSLSNATIEVISQCGHLPTMEKPEELSSMMSGFIKSICTHL